MATPFGKYALQRKLAEGGMAELFLARQAGLEGFEKLVVVKRILPALCTEQAFIHMFLNEARVAARLNHPNIVQLYDLGKVDDLYFIAMEFVHGEDLREVALQLEKDRGRVPVGLVCRVVADTLAGLHYAHTRMGADGKPLGLVHRDISPANVLVTYEGTVKICDFGIAKATTATSEQTQSGLFKGKFAYMSPEQSKGAPLDARSDVFAAGVLLWEMLTGRRLFKRENDMATLMAVGKDPVPPPRQLQREIPEALEKVVMRALERNVDRRYPTAQDMRGDLEALIRDQRWEADAMALQRWMRDLFAAKLKAQADDIRAAGLASLDDFLLTVEEHTNISWMPHAKSAASRSGSRPVATMYDDEKPTEQLPDRAPPAVPPPPPRPSSSGVRPPLPPPSLAAEADAVVPTVVLSNDVQALPPGPSITESLPGNPALASTAPMGWQAAAASTAKRPALDPPSRWRRLAVIASAALVAGGGALVVVLWPQKETSTPTIIAPPVVTVPEPAPRAAPPPPPPTHPKAATLEVSTDVPANISVDGNAQPFGRSASVEVSAGEPHIVSAQRPGHSVHKVSVSAPSPGERVPVALKLK